MEKTPLPVRAAQYVRFADNLEVGASFTPCRRADDRFLLSPSLPIVALGAGKPGVLLWDR